MVAAAEVLAAAAAADLAAEAAAAVLAARAEPAAVQQAYLAAVPTVAAQGACFAPPGIRDP